MTHIYYGDSINAQPPIFTISVNKFNVVFKDKENIKKIDFKNALETKKFVNWLVTI